MSAVYVERRTYGASRGEYITPAWTPQGAGDLADAQFEFKFYEGRIFNTISEAPEEADRTWLFRTVANEAGDHVINLAMKECFVSGDPLYTDADGTPSLPYGSAVITEVLAPKGYLADTTPYIMTIDFPAEGETSYGTLTNYNGRTGEALGDKVIELDNKLSVSNTPQRGGAVVRKLDKETKASSKEDYTTAGIRFAIVNRTGGDVVLNANEENEQRILDGQTVAVIEISEDGTARTGQILPPGSYDIYELREDAKISAGDVYPAEEDENASLLTGTSEYANHWYLFDSENHDSFTIQKEGDEVNLGNILNEESAVRAFFDDHLYPQIHTQAKDLDTEVHTAALKKDARIEDTVFFKGFLRDTEYKFAASLVDAENTEIIYSASEKIINTADYGTEGIVVMPELKVDTTNLSGHKLVVFEEVSRQINGIWTVVAEHKDVNDTDQTIWISEIRTQAKDSNGSKYVTTAAEGVITDTVYYRGLEPGREYIAEGYLTQDGKALEINGNRISSSQAFTAAHSGEGTVQISFTVPSGTVFGPVVVFEKVIDAEAAVTIAIHEDKDDEDQTVYLPQIQTVFTEKNGSKNIIGNKDTVIVDTVIFTDLDVDARYRLKAFMVDREGQVVQDAAGKDIIADLDFEPQEPAGQVEVEFSGYDLSNLAGDYVCFETLYKIATDRNGKEIEIPYALHRDLNSKEQTVTVSRPPQPQTGQMITPGKGFYSSLALAAAGLIIAACGIIALQKRKGNRS